MAEGRRWASWEADAVVLVRNASSLDLMVAEGDEK